MYQLKVICVLLNIVFNEQYIRWRMYVNKKKDFAFNVHVVKEYVKKIAGIKNSFKKYADGIEFHKYFTFFKVFGFNIFLEIKNHTTLMQNATELKINNFFFFSLKKVLWCNETSFCGKRIIIEHIANSIYNNEIDSIHIRHTQIIIYWCIFWLLYYDY